MLQSKKIDINRNCKYRINGVLKFPVAKSTDGDDVAAKPYQNVNTERLMDNKRTNTNMTFHMLKLEN